MNVASRLRDTARVLGRGGPGLCNVAVTNACNAKCDFCNFANGKVPSSHLRFIDADQFAEAVAILYQRDIRYISFFGGEPLLHPQLHNMIAIAVAQGMDPAIITNGWLLPARLDQLAAAGLRTIYISMDASDLRTHESNRGLHGLGERIRAATSRMAHWGMVPLAQVTMSKLIRDYCSLVPFLRDLGFAAVAFSYPQRKRLGSSSLAWSDSSELVNFSNQELIEAFDSIDQLRSFFPVNNPKASIADMKHHLRGEDERFVCYAGYKSFYLDWNYDVWRCDAWDQRLCSVWDFPHTSLVRDGCTACIADCYRDSSVMLHFAVSLRDSFDDLARGRVLAALRTLADRRNFTSLASITGNWPVLSRIAGIRRGG
jgi:MoaA/NifB/PqqE/SkfB family radical SAM enzyme